VVKNLTIASAAARQKLVRLRAARRCTKRCWPGADPNAQIGAAASVTVVGGHFARHTVSANIVRLNAKKMSHAPTRFVERGSACVVGGSFDGAAFRSVVR